MAQPVTIEQAMSWARIDLAPDHEQPRWSRVVLATCASIVGSLAVDALLVELGTRMFPSTRGFVHFQFSDYAKLTIVGVIVACLGWPVVTRISSDPRWLYLVLAIGTTVVLLAPDVWILLQGETAKGIVVLVGMHVAIAAVTYLCMIIIAPVRRRNRLD